jgi:hypothetical protein
VLTGNTPSYMLLKFRRYLQKILPSDNGRFAKKKKKNSSRFSTQQVVTNVKFSVTFKSDLETL